MTTNPKETRPPARPSEKRIPARPTGRPQPRPFMVEKPDARVQLPAGHAAGVWRSLGRVLGPVGAFLGSATALNEGEQAWIDEQRRRFDALPQPRPWVGDVRLHGYRGADVEVRPGVETWRPYSVDIGPPPLVVPRPDLLPNIPAAVPLPVRRIAPFYPLEVSPRPRARPAGAPREDWRDPLEVPDRGPDVRWPAVGPPVVGTSISVDPLPGGNVGIRFRLHTRRAEVRRPEYRDTKYGRHLVGFFNAVITRTYGVWSEVQDAAEAMANNLYGVQNGRIVSAMDVERGSVLRSFQGYLEGDYRLDTVGFAYDFSINQLEDMGYAVTARAQMGLATALAGDLGYKTLRQINVGVNMGEYEDVRSEWVRSAERWLSSWDEQRSARVRSLWE